jgi:cytochrome c
LFRPEAIRAAALAAALCCTGALAQDDERLIPGPGSTLTENKCKICHELQHIKRAQLSPGEWGDNLRNMKERGTPMTDDEMRVIHEYLATYYNRDKPAPAPSPDTLAAGGDDPVQKLLNANACNGCHSVDKRVVGPSFREVAAKYAGDRGAPARLMAKIRGGGQGAWGQVPMPPNPTLPDAELQRIAAWVLEQK